MENPRFKLDRRKFLKLTGGGLVVAFVLKDVLSFADEAVGQRSPVAAPGQVGAWIHVGEDGHISVYTGKVEFGQNIRTSLSQIVAEELKTPLSSITMVMGDTDLVPYDAGTFGSRTTPQMGTQLRKAAATARQALVEMAAKKWNVSATGLVAEDGMIVNSANNQKIGYGELTKGQQILQTISDDVAMIPAKDWKVAGKTVPKTNGRLLITGKHKYVSDMTVPGMMHGKVLRPPSYNAKLVSSDLSKAKNLPGVTVVRDGDFVGVVAPDVVTAGKALQLIDAKWEEETGQPSTANIFDYLVKNTETGEGDIREGRGSGNNKRGDVNAGLATSDLQHKQTYHINYIAHVPLEPRAAIAEWTGGKLTVWTGTQRPFGVQADLAETFKLAKEKVRVIVPDTGSGYGGKHSGEAAEEAARLSQAVQKPVKLVWTREEEFTWAYFRPGGVIDIAAGVKKDGTITSWQFTNYNSGNAGLDMQYRTVNKQTTHIPSKTPLRQGSYRALAATGNVFARECHLTDMARLIKMDPLEFRLKNLDDDRFKAVLQAAAKAFGWNNRSKAAGHGYGIAGGFEKGGHIATCAEVLVNSDKEVKILRITQAFECGAIVNPHHLENQIMGAIVQGLGGALFEKIDFAAGKIRNSSLAAYRVPRFNDVPKIEVILLNRTDLPSAGAGEAGIIGVAPAIRNAILDASGIALTTMPMIPNGALNDTGARAF